MEYLLLLAFFVLWWALRNRDSEERERQFRAVHDRLDSVERRLMESDAARQRAEADLRAMESPQPIIMTPPEPESTPEVDWQGQKARTPVPPPYSIRIPMSASTSPAMADATESQPVSRNQDSQAVSDTAIPDFVVPSSEANYAAEATQEPAANRVISLEEKLGANWLNKIGIVILVFGLAFFLAYKLKTLGPLGKVVLSYLASTTLLIGGLFLERRDRYRIFARAGIGGGWALTFFTTYAMYHISATQLITSQAVDLVLMMLVAVGMVWHSLRYGSQVVTGLAFLLALSTISISNVDFFSLVASAVLAVGLVAVTGRKQWFELQLAGLIGLFLNHFFWLRHAMSATGGPGHSFPEYFPSAALILLYWSIFRIAYIRARPADRNQELLSSAGAILNSAGVLGLLKYQSTHPEWAFWALIAMGAVEMLLAFYARPARRVAFIVLSTIASSLLLVAVPFRFHGASWSLLWLIEAELLFIAGLRMREIVFRRLGMIAGGAAALQLMIVDVLPVFSFRQTHPDPDRHFVIAISLATAAIIYWFNSQAAPRRWKELTETDGDAYALRLTSFLGLLSATACLWVLFPAGQTVVPWMLLALLLGFAADKLHSEDLATQADLLAVASLLRLLAINYFTRDHWGFFSEQAITVAASAALFYACTRRKTPAFGVHSGYIRIAYSWVGSAVLALLMWYELLPVSVAVGWAALGLVLFEIGIVRKGLYLRQQGYVLLAASFARIFFVNLNAGSPGHLLSPRVYTVVPLILAYFWVYERLQSGEEERADRIAAIAGCWLGVSAMAALEFFEVRPDWVVTAWAVLVLALIFCAWIFRRPVFLDQALLLTLVTAGRGILFNLYSGSHSQTSPWSPRFLAVAAAMAILALTLPVAFRLRKVGQQHDLSRGPAAWLDFITARPEQVLFFAPLVVVTILLAHQMRAGMITMAWSALGVAAFLLALLIGERTYRLAGLGLLLLGVAKILVIDVWKLAPTDRYTTLIVMGIALLLVSFLYTRYRETILKFL